MIFHELRLSNFLVFPGEQSISIPTKNEGNMVVILAPNNTGKTSIIRALKFLLYGHLAGAASSFEHKLLNDSAKSTTAIGGALSGWVEATIERDGEMRCIRRTITAKKGSSDTWRTAEMKLEEIKRGHSTVFVPDGGTLQRELRRLVPEMLFDAFYFQGEPLKGELLGDVGSIRKSLNAFLHEDRWEAAEQAAEAAREYYAKERLKAGGKDVEYRAKLEEEELLKKLLSQKREELRDTQAHLSEAIAEFDETTQALQELGKPAEADRLLGERNAANLQFDLAKRGRMQAEAELARLVGSSNGIAFVLSALPKAQKILGKMQADNILPADVTEGFVDRVLAQPKCVCGRDHDSQTRLAWNNYKTKTLSADLSRDLSDLLDSIGGSGRQSYVIRARQLAGTLAEKRSARAKSIVNEQKFSAAVRDADERLNAFPVEEVRSMSLRLSKVAAERQRLGGSLQQVEIAIRTTENGCKRVAEEIRRLAPKGANSGKLDQLKKAQDRSEKLRQLIHDSRAQLNKAFHLILQASVASYYDGSAYDGSSAKINPYTLLPAVEVNGEVRKNLGGGQSQLLALAYIVSLARLRKSLHKEMQRLGVGLGKLDDQSFLLDSPFDKMTETYAVKIAEFLKGNARQIVLLLARKQWEMVRGSIEPSADRIYAFDYHTLPEKIATLALDDFVYEVEGKRVSLLHKLPATDQHPHTTIVELV